MHDRISKLTTLNFDSDVQGPLTEMLMNESPYKRTKFEHKKILRITENTKKSTSKSAARRNLNFTL